MLNLIICYFCQFLFSKLFLNVAWCQLFNFFQAFFKKKKQSTERLLTTYQGAFSIFEFFLTLTHLVFFQGKSEIFRVKNCGQRQKNTTFFKLIKKLRCQASGPHKSQLIYIFFKLQTFFLSDLCKKQELCLVHFSAFKKKNFGPFFGLFQEMQ